MSRYHAGDLLKVISSKRFLINLGAIFGDQLLQKRSVTIFELMSELSVLKKKLLDLGMSRQSVQAKILHEFQHGRYSNIDLTSNVSVKTLN